MDTLSLSILSIPAYHLLTLFPHAYAIGLTTTHLPSKQWDNRNPRSSALKSRIASLPPPIVAAYERAEACSANGFENMPLFAAAIVLGHVAGLSGSEMDSFAGSVLAVRVLYTWVYLRWSTNQKGAAVRSLVWALHTGLCWRLFWRAAVAFGGREA